MSPEQENNNSENSSVENGIKKNKLKLSKNKKFILFGILGLAILAGTYFYIHSITYVSTDDAYVEGDLVPVSSKVSGTVDKVFVEDNQYVNKGDLLAKIDSRDYKVQYDQIEAKLEAAIEKQKKASVNIDFTSITSQADKQQASSNVSVAKTGIEIADKQVLEAKANLKQANQEVETAKADLDLAQTEYDRNAKLLTRGGVSQKDLDRASTNLKTKQAKFKFAQEKVSSVKAKLQIAYANKKSFIKSLNIALSKAKGANTVKEQIAMSNSTNKIAMAEIKQLKAAEEQAKLNLSYTSIYAPQSGHITSKNVQEGAYIRTGQPLMVIVPEKRWIIANFKETQLTNIKAGQPVTIKVDAYPDAKFKGKVDSIQSSTGAKTSLFPPENAVGSFVKVVQRIPVKIIFNEYNSNQHNIVPGMSAVPEVKIK